MYEKNIRLLESAVLTRAVIRNVSLHKKADGSLDVEGNLKLWDKAMEPYMVFVPARRGNGVCLESAKIRTQEVSETADTIIIAHGGGFSWRTGCEGVNVAWFFHNQGFNTAILSAGSPAGLMPL